MRKYSAIIFDLFDTILNFNFNHLPTVQIKGFRSRTTSIEVYEVFKDYFPNISFSDFYDPFINSYHEFQEIKLKEFKEYPNRDRFILMLEKMEISHTKNTDTLIEKMVIAHMNALSSCIEYPLQNKETLEYLKSKDYPLAIVSNFDYAPTTHQLLKKHDLNTFFETVVISEEVGWRKPKDVIFETAISKLKIDPSDTLFIGDNYNADVVGSKALGMDAAWINRKKDSEENLSPKPDYIINNLKDICEFL